MAATDQNYRSQYGLDIVFAVSSIVMLATTVWMLVDDYRREYKVEQRQFRDVEMAMAQREALLKMPTEAAFRTAKAAVDQAKEERQANQPKIDKYGEEIRALLPEKDRADLSLSNFKADLDSKKSFRDIEVDRNGYTEYAKALTKEIENLEAEIAKARDKSEKQIQEIKNLQRQKDALEQPLTKATGSLKKLLDDFDRQVNLAIKKQWRITDTIRDWWMIDAFASPTRIDQITLRDLGIDYNFTYAIRFDRCMTCHKGIARGNYTKENLEALWYDPTKKMDDQFKEAHKILTNRKELLAGLDEGRNLPDASQLKLSALSDKRLTQARISEFAVHPRLDIYVGPNSKHPSEKFGCTICHSGQPSGTSFTFAAHTPNNNKTKEEWVKTHDWEAQHMWDFPMMPSRFTESSCLKCHHQVVDLYTDGNKSEAPKLLKGYNLISEFGCFGCHEINGYKGGRQIGPDLRLEPNPPLDKLNPAERAKLYADPDNPPGAFRKVAPSLFRISEKTNEAWAAKWIMSPREFRPDTKMPHYYGLSNNDENTLAGTGQEKFPVTEIHGIVHVLFKGSREYLDQVDASRKPDQIKQRETIVQALQSKLDAKEKLTDAETRQLQDAQFFLSLRNQPQRLSDEVLKVKGDAVMGRDLFTTKGCLACHSHASTNEPDEKWPAAPSEAHFGPNLTQLKGKLVPKDGKTDKATVWLINWLKNPTIHSPRTRMPITHLNDQEAANIAAWLLAQDVPKDEKTGKISPDLQSEKWATLNVPAPDEADLQNLARVYLGRVLAESEVKQVFDATLNANRAKDLGIDERELVDLLVKAANQKELRREALLHFAGKKAIGRLGCYGCHDIPGFENSKPIGTALNEWGKKDPSRLAFEDIANYVNNHFEKKQVVDKLVDEDGYPLTIMKGGKVQPLYERFYYDALMHSSREGYLNQKILDPRSYDYNRLRAWDDRSRMPQFSFAQVMRKPAEEPPEFSQRKLWAEAMGTPLDNDAKPRGVEPVNDYIARKQLEEAQNRETVMTFIFGLIGEPIPLQYLNQPTPDRLAEIKGRQVIDRFNCAGCHVFRPGAYEFKLTNNAKQSLDALFIKNAESSPYKDDHFFQSHRAWNQPIQTGDVILAHGVRPLLTASNKKPRVNIVLSEALRVGAVVAKGKEAPKDVVMEFRASELMPIDERDLIWPPPTAFKTTDTFRAWEKQFGTQGGAFAALLGSYLKDDSYPEKKKYLEPGPAVPPQLIWQGERTQPDWLFQFLLDPHKVREMTVLRMPKFSLSVEDARALVDYFAAVERRYNPDINLISPYPKIPQRSELDSDYWRAKTAEYIQNLKTATNANKQTVYQEQVEAFKPVWDMMIKDWKSEAANAETRKKAADAELAKVNKELTGAKGDAQKEEQLKKKKENAELDAGRWKTEKERLDKLVASKTSAALEKDWSETEAYALAGYRLAVNQCNKCHAVGTLEPQQPDGRGPSLNLASSRLRPGWAEHWIANPQRFVPYTTAMPVYFKKSDPAALVPWLPGTPLQQLNAARDTILNLPRIGDLPLTRLWIQSGAK